MEASNKNTEDQLHHTAGQEHEAQIPLTEEGKLPIHPPVEESLVPPPIEPQPGPQPSLETIAVISPLAAEQVAASELTSTPSVCKRFSSWLQGINKLFLLTVVIPTTFACLYFGLIASDVYISESRFVIRSPQRQAPTGLGAVLQGVGFSSSQNDSYSVHDFMTSRDALAALDQTLQLRNAFGSDRVDVFSRFGGTGFDDSFEALYRYYLKHLTLNLDAASSISTMRTYAFTPDDAFHLNQKLLEFGEELINRLNERGRQDMIRFAETEVARAEQRVKEASQAVSSYRNQQAVFDPEKQSSLQFQQISKLQDELIATRTLLAQMQTFTSENPQIATLNNRIESLQRQINIETAKITGGGRASLSSKSVDYERLILERSFAEKQLATALASLEQARNDALRKQLYLERIVQPSKPDAALEPRRLRAIASTLALGLISWGILTMLVAGVREHQD